MFKESLPDSPFLKKIFYLKYLLNYFYCFSFHKAKYKVSGNLSKVGKILS